MRLDKSHEIIFNSLKEFPNMFVLKIYHGGFMVSINEGGRVRKDKPVVADSSIMRSRQAIEDIVICNEFDYFCTFTFDPKKHDRYDIIRCQRFMNNWIRNCKNRHSPGLKYLIVPELHKDKAIHFHALIKDFNGTFKPSKVKQNGRDVLNIRNWRAGFSTAVKIDNIEAVSRYIRKYITKDMILLPGRKRYYCSNNLIRPKKSTNVSLKSFLSRKPFYHKKFNEFDYFIYHKQDEFIDNLETIATIKA